MEGSNLEEGEDEETTKLLELLSKVQPPQVSEIGATEVVISWQGVDCTEASSGPFPEIEASDFTYEVLVAERSQNGKFRKVYQ